MRIKTNEKISEEFKKRYETAKDEIVLGAVLSSVYAEKVSSEAVHTKVNHQLNAMNMSIDRINPKFQEKSKNYDKIKEELVSILENYEANLKQFCKRKDTEIHEKILQKVEMEAELWMAILAKEYWVYVDKNEWKETQNRIKKYEKEIKILTKKIEEANEQKVQKVFEAMETEEKMLSTQIRKPHSFKKITKFFANRFHTYQVILKSVFLPIKQRIDEFKVNELQEVDFKNQEFNLKEMEKKIKQTQEKVFQKTENQKICKSLGIF